MEIDSLFVNLYLLLMPSIMFWVGFYKGIKK